MRTVDVGAPPDDGRDRASNATKVEDEEPGSCATSSSAFGGSSLSLTGVPSGVGLALVADDAAVFAPQAPGVEGPLCITCVFGEGAATCLPDARIERVSASEAGGYWALRESVGDPTKRDVLRVGAGLSRYDVVVAGLTMDATAFDATRELVLFGRSSTLVARDVATGEETLLSDRAESLSWIGHGEGEVFWTARGGRGLSLRAASLGRSGLSEELSPDVALASASTKRIAWMTRASRDAEVPALRTVFVRTSPGTVQRVDGAPRRVYALAVDGDDVWALGDELARARVSEGRFETVKSEPTTSNQPATSKLFVRGGVAFYQDGAELRRVGNGYR